MLEPTSLTHALELLAREPGVWRPFAGGTDIMVMLEAGALHHRQFLNIWKLNELRGIEVAQDAVLLGALTTYTDVLKDQVMNSEFPLLVAAARCTGTIATQNRGTLGGNIVNASPAADTPPVLLIYEADVELLSIRGVRWLPYVQFHIGYRQTRLCSDELVGRIRLLRHTDSWQPYYRKVAARRVQAISKVCFAGLRNPSTGEVRIGVGGVAPVPLRCTRTEVAVRDGTDPAYALDSEIAPIDDIRSTALYRRRVAQNLLHEFLYRKDRTETTTLAR